MDTPPEGSDHCDRGRTLLASGRERIGVALGALVLGATVALVGAPASADVLPVTTTADGGAGSLRDALAQASANATTDEIVLEAGATYVLDDCAAGDLDHTATDDLTLTGNGATIHQTCAGERVLETDSDLTVTDLTISGGDLPGGLGGGIEADTASITAVRSTFTGNRGGTGGALAAIRVTLVASTVSDNTAGSGAGGIWADQTITATSSTIAGNTAATGGGGLTVVNTSATLLFSTVAGNSAPTGANVQLQAGSDELLSFGSVIALPGGGDDCDLSAGVSTTSQGSNLSSDASCGFGGGPGDQAGAGDPQLGPLAANGGPTETRLPLPGSPLLDAADCAAAPEAVPTDQRGVSRPQGPACDIGSVEVEVEGPGEPAPTPPTAPPASPVAADAAFTG